MVVVISPRPTSRFSPSCPPLFTLLYYIYTNNSTRTKKRDIRNLLITLLTSSGQHEWAGGRVLLNRNDGSLFNFYLGRRERKKKGEKTLFTYTFQTQLINIHFARIRLVVLFNRLFALSSVRDNMYLYKPFVKKKKPKSTLINLHSCRMNFD